MPRKRKASHYHSAKRRARHPDNPDRAERVCLKCQRLFESEWIGNRLCRVCTNTEGKPNPPARYGGLGEHPVALPSLPD